MLNAVFPGLGHLSAGRVKWALILGVPMLVPLVVLAGAALTSNPTALAARLFDPVVLTALLVAQGVILAWRLVAVGATRALTPIRPTAATLAAVVVSLAIVVGPQLFAAGVTLDAAPGRVGGVRRRGRRVGARPHAAARRLERPRLRRHEPQPVAPSASPSATPSASPTPAVPRINVLLIGMDSGVGRNTALTDTMIVASLDPVAKTVSMVSIPRDMVDVPLADGRTYKAKINGLVSYVRWNPGKFPGAKNGQSVLAARSASC